MVCRSGNGPRECERNKPKQRVSVSAPSVERVQNIRKNAGSSLIGRDWVRPSFANSAVQTMKRIDRFQHQYYRQCPAKRAAD